MKKKTVKIMAVLLGVGLFATGCGNRIPDLTEEQAQEIGEYAAGLLLKYDANHRSRLVDLALYDTPEETPEASQETVPEEPKGGMPPVADTPVISIGEGTEGTAPASVPMEQLLGLPEGMTIVYQGAHSADSYPDETAPEDAILAIDAVEGKKLLILEFLIENQTQTDQQIDIFSVSPVFHVTVNGSYQRNALTTLLENDLTTFMGTVPAGNSVPAVVIVEVDPDTAAAIGTIKLSVKNADTNSTIQLQ